MKILFTAKLEPLVSFNPKGTALSLLGLFISLSAFAYGPAATANTPGKEYIKTVRGHAALAVPTGRTEALYGAASAPSFSAAKNSYAISDAPPLGAVAGDVDASDANGLYSQPLVSIPVALGATATAFSSISWGTAASQPYTVTEGQGKVVNGKLYTFGGFDSQKSTFTPTSRAYSYNPVTNTWTAIAPMPPMNGTNYGGVTHAGFATDGTNVYFAGGYTSNSSGTGQIFGTREVWKYIVAENRYERLPDLPVAIAAGQLEFLNGRLHHIGGTNAARTSDLGNHYVLQLNDLAAGWKSLASLPSPRQHAGSAVHGGKIYYIGGQTGHDSNLSASKLVHQYDPVTNTWTQVADLPVPSGASGRGHISSAVIVVDDRILVLGGETEHVSGVTNMVSAYTPATNTWENLTPLPRSRYSGVAALLGGNIYYTGGSNSSATYKGVPGGTQTQQQEVVSFTLFNASTKQAIQTLTNSSTLNLATLPSKNLNVRASTSPSTVGSVVFALSGTQSKNATESRAPYDLMGDDGAWTPTVGSYTLKATPYTSSGGGGTAGTALTVSFTVVDQEPDTDNTLISNISASSGRSYALGELSVGVQHYTDRTYKITSVPSSLGGASLIRTANDDKKSTGSSLLSFSLSEQATVYVAYDPRSTALPGWLSGWQKLTDRIGVDDSQIGHMELYSKSFPAGSVSLGGNLQSPAAGAQNNYFVVAKAAAPATGLISNVSASSGRSYTLGALAVGVQHYTDRTYKITSVPSTLGGASLIRTANDDKKSTGSSLLSFSLSEQATVYVAYDPRSTALPAWLSGWQKLTDRIGVDDSQISHMELYSKSFPAGSVSLGGNLQSPAAGAQNNYFVMAKADQSTLLFSNASHEHGTTTLSEAESNGLSLAVYPNPATGGQVFVEAANFGRQEAVTLTLHDVLGRVVASVDAVTDQQGYAHAEVPVQQLKRGMYIIRARAAGGEAQAKLLVR